MAMERGLSRRAFLNVGVTVAGVGLLAACAPSAPPAAKPADSGAAAPKPTEAAKPAAPAATTAPAAAAKPADAAKPATGAAPAAAGKPGDQKLGDQLIGKWEGPEILPDAKRPAKLGEAPMLADMVKASKLPPVEQRVPD